MARNLNPPRAYRYTHRNYNKISQKRRTEDGGCTFVGAGVLAQVLDFVQRRLVSLHSGLELLLKRGRQRHQVRRDGVLGAVRLRGRRHQSVLPQALDRPVQGASSRHKGVLRAGR